MASKAEQSIHLHANKNFKKIFKIIFIVKLISNIALPLLVPDFPTTKGYFQPDEYYQTLNVSYLKYTNEATTGNLTWEWNKNLRSYLFPFIVEMLGYRLFNQVIPYVIKFYLSFISEFLIFIGMYWNSEFIYQCVLYVRYLEDYIPKSSITFFGLKYGPIFSMCLINSYFDYYSICFIYKIYSLCVGKKGMSDKALSNKIIKISFLIITSNFFNNFFQNRLFINTFEMGLNVIGLYFFNWQNESSKYNYIFISTLFGFLSILQRPTNAFIWGTVGIYKIFSDHKNTIFNVKFQLSALISLVVALAITCSTDYYFYNKLTFPVWTFIEFNYSKNLSKFYGSSSWNFHIFQSIPIINGVTMPLSLLSLIKFISKPNIIKALHITLIVNTIMFSLINHKEFRFLYPAQSIYVCISVIEYMDVSDKKNNSFLSKVFKKVPDVLLQSLCVVSFFSGLLVSYFNESGVIEVCNFLNNNHQIYTSVSFWMPCHSTPGISYMPDYKNKQWELTCEPPLFLMDEENPDKVKKALDEYLDESDIFYLDPRKWISENLSDDPKSEHFWTDCIGMFQVLGDDIYDDVLKPQGYILEKKWFNTIQHWDHRRQGDVQLYCKSPEYIN